MTDIRPIVRPAYFVSAGMLLFPLTDVATSLYPWRVLEAQWRFGAIGLASNSLVLPLAGLVLAYAVSTLEGHRVTRRIIGGFSLVAFAACVLALGLFGLDALQTRAAVNPEMRTAFHVASGTAAVKTAFAAMTFLILWLSWVKTRRKSGETGVRAPAVLAVARGQVAAAQMAGAGEK